MNTTGGALAVICRRQQIAPIFPNPGVMIIIMNSSARITGGWGIPHCGFFNTSVSSPHYFFLNSTTVEQTFNRPLCVQVGLTTNDA